MWTGKSVLITGGSGSLGTALAQHILPQNPKRLAIFSRGEHRQEALANALDASTADPAGVVRFFLGDVRDRKRLELACRAVDIVIHAAALKVVPSIEYNPFEAVATNVIGTQNVCQAAIDAGVDVVCSIGSDKQVAPINTYGATKLVAERLIVSANSYAAGRTRFVAVRYGNVAGSAGSIIPAWLAKKAKGQKLPLTHVDMTRFSIRMEEAIKLIEAALVHGEAGQIFVPRLPSFRMTDLATAIGQPYTLIGPRPGEKMHECLLTAEEFASADRQHDYYVLNPNKVRALADGFDAYTSDTNTWWLGVTALRELVDAVRQSAD